MQIAPLHADARADARASARRRLLERRLDRFFARYRPCVRALAERHPRLEDLALSFPALLFALAVPRAGSDAARGIDLVIAGAKLSEVAACAGVPMWLRRFQPEALKTVLPPLPDGPLFRRQIANHLPRSMKHAAWWLENVGNATKWADEAVAVWVAREVNHGLAAPERQELRLVCLWAWYSVHGLVHSPNVPWRADMKLATAREAAEAWRARLLFQLDYGGPVILDMWIQPGTFGGLTFVPLDSYEAIQEEAAAMRHCLMGYLKNFARQQCRAWSVRRDGERVATVEVRLPSDGHVPYVAQLKAKNNDAASLDVWEAARAWLTAQDIAHLKPRSPARVFRQLERKDWIALWRPYWLGKRRFPKWLPLRPSRGAMNRLGVAPRFR